MVDLEVQECKGLDPNKIYIINIKRANIPAEYFKMAIDDFTSQLDKLGLKYAINLADHIDLEISEIIPNNKFILNLNNSNKENGGE